MSATAHPDARLTEQRRLVRPTPGGGWLAALLACAALALSSCQTRYKENDLELVSRYRAKALCSCLFVMQQSLDYCRRWSKQQPNVASFRIDRETKTVHASALTLWSGKARFVNEKFGCVLEPGPGLTPRAD